VQELKRKGVSLELASTAVRNFFGEKGQLQSGRQDAEDDDDGEGESGEDLQALLLLCCCWHAGAALRIAATAHQHAVVWRNLPRDQLLCCCRHPVGCASACPCHAMCISCKCKR
jgi:hypothetical protein